MKKLFKNLVITLATCIFFNFYSLAKEQSKVVEVIDGDTILVEYQGKKETVRLIGIDCYETYPNNRAYKQAYTDGINVEKVIEKGKLAGIYTQTLVKKGDKITLEFEENKRDKYKRLLAYVYLKNGKMLNEQLLKSKNAKLYIFKTTIYKEKLFNSLR